MGFSFTSFYAVSAFLALIALANSASVSKPTCQKDTCKNYGECIENYMGMATCSCLPRFYGARCEQVKKTYSVLLEISSVTRGNSSWTKEIVNSMLKVKNSEVAKTFYKLTLSLLNEVLSQKTDFLGGRFLFQSTKIPEVLLELQGNSSMTALEVQAILLKALKEKNFIIRLMDGEVTLQMETASAIILDFDECKATALESCGQNAFCENKVGSFQCNCKDGYVKDGHICVFPNVKKSTGVDWNQVLIWGGMVLIVLFWMLIIALCIRKRIVTGKKQKDDSRASSLQRRSGDVPVIPKIKVTDTFNGDKRRQSGAFINGAMEQDEMSLRDLTTDRFKANEIDLQNNRRRSLYKTDSGMIALYLDSYGRRMSDAQSSSSIDSELTIPDAYPRELVPNSKMPPRNVAKTSSAPHLNISLGDLRNELPSRERCCSTLSVEGRGRSRNLHAIARIESLPTRMTRSLVSVDTTHESLSAPSPDLPHSDISGSLQEEKIYEEVTDSVQMPEKDY